MILIVSKAKIFVQLCTAMPYKWPTAAGMQIGIMQMLIPKVFFSISVMIDFALITTLNERPGFAWLQTSWSCVVIIKSYQCEF